MKSLEDESLDDAKLRTIKWFINCVFIFLMFEMADIYSVIQFCSYINFKKQWARENWSKWNVFDFVNP